MLHAVRGLRFRSVFVVSMFGAGYWGCSPGFENCADNHSCVVSTPHKEAGVTEAGGAVGAGGRVNGNGNAGGTSMSGRTGSGGGGIATGGASGGKAGEDAGSAGAGGDT